MTDGILFIGESNDGTCWFEFLGGVVLGFPEKDCVEVNQTEH